MTKEQIELRNWNWQQAENNIINEFLMRQKNTKKCAECKKVFKLIDQELKFYSDLNIPRPEECFFCRLNKRMQSRNPRTLWHRQCMCTQPDHLHHGRCNHEFETTYSPDRKELVYCEDCYNREIY